MNKLKKILIVTFVINFLSCKSNKQAIELSQSNSEYPIVLYMNKQRQEVVRLKLPIKISLTNKSYSKQAYISIEYLYSNYKKGIPNSLYREKKGNLVKVRQSKKKEIGSHKIQDYIIYTRHNIDTNKVIQNNFKPYIEKMISKNIDTLAIGTINNFKREHNKLLKSLIKDDRISVKIWSNKDVSIPVKF